MDPALFRIDWDVLAELLVTIIVLAFFIERALSLLFEYRYFVLRFDKKGAKEPIALIVSIAIVAWLEFDSLAILFRLDAPTWWGYLITAAIVAGGSKASIALFQNVMNAKSTVMREVRPDGDTTAAQARGGARKKRR
jgi:hypothetical protein